MEGEGGIGIGQEDVVRKGLGKKKPKEEEGSQEEKIEDQEGKGELRVRVKLGRSKRREVKSEGVRGDVVPQGRLMVSVAV